MVPTQLTYQHLCKKQHTYTTFPAWNMCLSIWHTLHLAAQLPHQTMVHHKPLQDQCTATYQFTSNSSENDRNQDSSPEHSDEEEDFQTVPMDDEHWMTDMVPERTFCIHENGLPNNVCQYPCPYGNSYTLPHIWTA